MEVQHPWNLPHQDRQADKWRWAYGYLANRGIDPSSEYYLRPTATSPVEDQVTKLVKFACCRRNWVTFICESPSYMRTLFNYTMVSYVFTTTERAMVVDAEDLIECIDEPQGEMRDMIEWVDLLMVCYVDPEHLQFKWKRAAVANLLQRRKLRKLSTFIDLYIPYIETPLNDEKRKQYASTLIDVLGPHGYDLFTGSTSKNVIVRHRGRTNGARTAAIGR